MKTLLNQLVVAASGKLGTSAVFYGSGGRQFSREYVVPGNPQTAYQVASRGRLAEASAAWSAMTDAQREAWNSAASGVTRRDMTGQSYELSGRQLYMQVQSYRLIDNQVISPTVPSKTVTPFSASAMTVAENADPATGIELSWRSPSETPAFLFIRLTAPLGSDARNARLTDYRIFTTAPSNSVFTAPDLVATFSYSQMRQTLGEGDFIGVELLPLNSGYYPGQKLWFPSVAVAPYVP